MGSDGRQETPEEEAIGEGEGGEEEEGTGPAEAVREEEAEGNTDGGGQGIGGHHNADGTAVTGGRDDVANDGEDARAGDPTEEATKTAGDEEGGGGIGEATGGGGEDESGIEEEEGTAAVESIHEGCGDETGDAGDDGIDGDEAGEGGRRDIPDPHELRTEGHHDHEIHDVGELDRGEQHEEESFGGRLHPWDGIGSTSAGLILWDWTGLGRE